MKKILATAALCLSLLCGCAAEAAQTEGGRGAAFPEGAAEAFRAVELPEPPEVIPVQTIAPAPDLSVDPDDPYDYADLQDLEDPDDPNAAGTLALLGPNMVYVGEGFTYRCETRGIRGAEPEISWRCEGDAASVDENGRLEALKKGNVILTASDAATGLERTILVHIVETAQDVNFVPKVNGIPLINKTYPLPADYDPGDLAGEVYSAFYRLIEGAAADGIEIFLISGYRPYWMQQQVHERWVEEYNEEIADTLSARAGFSEHQLGYSIDVNSVLSAFADTAEGKWLADNCWKYGFIIRYPKGKEKQTGYIYEPWHIRYLGEELAREVTESGLCLEEYFGIDSYYR